MGRLDTSRHGGLLLGNPAEAMGAFEAALAVRPTEREARLGWVEATLDAGHPAAALGRVESLLERSPDAWTLAAAAARALGRPDDARLFARKAQSCLAQGNPFISPHRRVRLREDAPALPHPAPEGP